MWLTVADIRKKFNIEQNAYPDQIASAILSASRKIRRWLDAETYAEAVAETPPTDPEKLIRYESVLDAHAFLTMYYLAVSVGSRLASAGFIKQAQDAKSVEGNTITNQYLTPAELALNKQGYLNEAQDIVEPYQTESSAVDILTTEGTSFSPLEIVF